MHKHYSSVAPDSERERIKVQHVPGNPLPSHITLYFAQAIATHSQHPAGLSSLSLVKSKRNISMRSQSLRDTTTHTTSITDAVLVNMWHTHTHTQHKQQQHTHTLSTNNKHIQHKQDTHTLHTNNTHIHTSPKMKLYSKLTRLYLHIQDRAALVTARHACFQR